MVIVPRRASTASSQPHAPYRPPSWAGVAADMSARLIMWYFSTPPSPPMLSSRGRLLTNLSAVRCNTNRVLHSFHLFNKLQPFFLLTVFYLAFLFCTAQQRLKGDRLGTRKFNEMPNLTCRIIAVLCKKTVHCKRGRKSLLALRVLRCRCGPICRIFWRCF